MSHNPRKVVVVGVFDVVVLIVDVVNVVVLVVVVFINVGP